MKSEKKLEELIIKIKNNNYFEMEEENKIEEIETEEMKELLQEDWINGEITDIDVFECDGEEIES